MSKQFKKLSHTIYKCKHQVSCPKYRFRISKDGIGDLLWKEDRGPLHEN